MENPQTGQAVVTLAVAPVIHVLEQAEKLFREPDNKYDLYDKMVETDAVIYGSIRAMATLVWRSYKGFGYKVGKDIKPREQAVIDALEEFSREFDIPGFVYNCAMHMGKYGNYVNLLSWRNGRGVTEIQPVPIKYLTALEKLTQKGNTLAQIFESNYYVLNENITDKESVWPSDRILHVSWGDVSEVKDLQGRYTYGVWSLSPMESLKLDALWKMNIKINDILLRDRIVPREVHSLPIEAFDPSKFAGDTMEAKIAAAQAAVETACSSYAETLKKTKVDQGYVVPSGVEVKMLEATVKYTEPNQLASQLDGSAAAVTGVPNSAVTGIPTGPYASQIFTQNWAKMAAEFAADRIAKSLVELAEIHLRKKRVSFREGDIFVKMKTVVGEMGEVARTMAVMWESGLFHMAEIRELGGYEPLTDEQIQDIIDYREKIQPPERSRTGSNDETSSQDIRRRATEFPITPRSQRQRQETV